MPLSPYPRSRDNQYSSNSNSQKEIPCEKSNICEDGVEVEREGQSIRREDGSKGRSEHRDEGQYDENSIAFPKGPILGAGVSMNGEYKIGYLQEGRWDHRLAGEPKELELDQRYRISSLQIRMSLLEVSQGHRSIEWYLLTIN